MKLMKTYATEIYPTEGGYIGIKQENPDPYDDDDFVMFAPHQIPAVIRMFLQLLRDEFEPGEVGFYGGTVKPEEFEAAGIDLNQPFQLTQENEDDD